MSDIHANVEAFTAVLGDMEKRGEVEEIWCLGDIVDYGPEPRQCLKLLQRYKHVCVAGNHDWGAIGKIDTSTFTPDAVISCQWTAGQLKREDTGFLENLPPVIEKGEFTLAHGSPREPLFEYVISTSIAEENLAFFQSPFCLLGHSHLPTIFKYEGDSFTLSQFRPNIGLVLGRNRLIINPGSVGQPRDGDPRASYAIYNSETRMIRLYRVPYDIEATQEKMMQAGLPIRLVDRLRYGA